MIQFIINLFKRKPALIREEPWRGSIVGNWDCIKKAPTPFQADCK